MPLNVSYQILNLQVYNSKITHVYIITIESALSRVFPDCKDNFLLLISFSPKCEIFQNFQKNEH